jgi:hypothetical protein
MRRRVWTEQGIGATGLGRAQGWPLRARTDVLSTIPSSLELDGQRWRSYELAGGSRGTAMAGAVAMVTGRGREEGEVEAAAHRALQVCASGLGVARRRRNRRRGRGVRRLKTKGIQRWGGSHLEVVGADEAADGRGARGHIGAARRPRWPRWYRATATAPFDGGTRSKRGAWERARGKLGLARVAGGHWGSLYARGRRWMNDTAAFGVGCAQTATRRRGRRRCGWAGSVGLGRSWF